MTSAPAGRPAPLHLAVALDGAGWHPAAWREADAQPQRLFTAGYWTELAQQAERGLLDFLTIEDGLDLQYDDRFQADARLDRVRGRLDAVLIAARAAPATRHIGFVPTAITTHTEPFHLSKAIATLDYVSSGRAGIRVQVAVRDGTAAHFGRRESPPLRADRLDDPDVQRLIADHFDEAADYVEVLRRLWDSWEDDAEIRDVTTGRFIDRNKLHYIEFEGRWFSVKGPSITPRPPQGQPIIAAASADAIFSRHSTLKAGQTFYADVKGRLPKFGRTRGELLILPAATFVLGDTDAEAAETAREVRRAQVSPQTALKFIEQLWNTELPGFDVDGPLPAFDPVVSDNLISKGRASVRQFAKDPVALAGEWRARAEAANLSAREVVIEVTGRQSFIGSAETIATTINELVQADAADGYILVPHITPGGLTSFVDHVVPLLQERGVFRADYTGTTLRDHLGLAPLRRPGETATTRAAS